jgi:hypothetical protein
MSIPTITPRCGHGKGMPTIKIDGELVKLERVGEAQPLNIW